MSSATTNQELNAIVLSICSYRNVPDETCNWRSWDVFCFNIVHRSLIGLWDGYDKISFDSGIDHFLRATKHNATRWMGNPSTSAIVHYNRKSINHSTEYLIATAGRTRFDETFLILLCWFVPFLWCGGLGTFASSTIVGKGCGLSLALVERIAAGKYRKNIMQNRHCLWGLRRRETILSQRIALYALSIFNLYSASTNAQSVNSEVYAKRNGCQTQCNVQTSVELLIGLANVELEPWLQDKTLVAGTSTPHWPQTTGQNSIYHRAARWEASSCAAFVDPWINWAISRGLYSPLINNNKY